MLVNVMNNIFHIGDIVCIRIVPKKIKRHEYLYPVYLNLPGHEPIELFGCSSYSSAELHLKSIFSLLESGETTITRDSMVRKSRLKS